MRSSVLAIILFAPLVVAAQSTEPRVIQIEAHDFKYAPDRIEAQSGRPLVVRLVNRGGMPHNIEFELPKGEIELPKPLAPGESGELKFDAPTQPGSYVYYCPVADHKQRGMTGKLVVPSPGSK